MALFRIQSLPAALLLTAALNVAWPAVGRAATDQPPAPELASDTSDTLNSDWRPAYDAHDWDKSLAVLAAIIPKVPAESYDAAYVYRAEALLYLQNKNNQPLGLQCLEKSLAIDDRKHYFPQKDVQEILYNISQVSYGEAVTAKDPKIKRPLFERATQTLERWLEHADLRTLNQDNFYYVAVVYFTLGQGTELGPDQKPDKAMTEKALNWLNKGLRSVTHPRDSFYQLKVAALYQLDRYKETAECIEFQLKQKPDNKNNWQELAVLYQQLANSAEEKKDKENAFRYYVRLIVTYDRAQKLGFLTTPKDNYNVVAYYQDIDQYSKACELLEKGLKGETIESTPQNWTTLGAWYQLIHRNDKSVQAFITAAELFPTNAEIEYQLATVYLGVPDESKAFEHIKACIAKGGTEKPHVGWLFYAYTAMDLQRFDEALKGAQEAAVAAKKINATDAVKQAEKMEEAIKASVLDLENRRQQTQR